MKKKKFPTSPQIRAVLSMLQSRSRTLSLHEIADDTGLTHSWLAAFQAEQIDDPSYSKLEALWKYLDTK